MRRLSGEDAGFLAMELPGQPMNSMAVGVLAPADREMSLEELRHHLAARMDELPSWRWRIVEVPGGLHQPMAVDVGEPDLNHHVRELSIGGHTLDGDDLALEALFATLAEEHLEMERPLWRVWLVSGFEDGRQAIVVKYHHALADGTGAVTTLSRVFSDATLPPPYDAGPSRPRHLPGRMRLLVAALWAHLLALLTLAPMVVRTVRGSRRVKEQRARAQVEMPPYSEGAPRTLLNDAFSPRRTYTRSAMPLAQVKQVKDAAGVTLNDVVLAVVAGASVRYLAQFEPEFDPLTSRPLLTTVPMAFEAVDAPVRQHGNRFWSFTTSLATDVADPWERLQVISATAREGKAQLEAFGPDLVPDWLDRLPPRLARRGIVSVRERLEASATDADASILVSNIRGPAAPFALGGRLVESVHCDGPPSNGVGINVMVWSYGPELTLGILGYAEALAHPQEFKRMLAESLAELVVLSEQAPVVPAA